MQATQMVHWPGKDTPMCDRHAKHAQTVAAALGFALSSTPLLAALLAGVEINEEQLICKNCENEEKKKSV